MNSSHIDIETLSAYLDGQATVGERARVTNHLVSCARCATDLARLQQVSRSLAGLGRVEMTAYEHRALRQGLVDKVARRSVRLRQPGRLQWSFAGAFALIAVTIVGLSVVRSPQRGNDSLTEAAAPAQDTAGAIVIDSDDQIPSRVLALPEVRARGGERDSAAALKSEAQANAPARTGQPEALSAQAPPVPGVAGPEEVGDGGGGSGAGGSGAYADATSGGGGGVQGYGRPESANAMDFSNAAGSACSEAVAAGQSEPLAPVTIREATYKGSQSWLAVFSAPDGGLVAFVVDPQGCGGGSPPHILSRSGFPPG